MITLYCHLSEIIQEKEPGLSVNALSKAVGFRRDTLTDLINNHEMDNKRINSQLIVNLCDYFNVTVGDLFSIREG